MGIILGLVQDFLKCGTGANAADVNFIVFDAADHVHVEHGHGLIEWFGRLFDPLG